MKSLAWCLVFGVAVAATAGACGSSSRPDGFQDGTQEAGAGDQDGDTFGDPSLGGDGSAQGSLVVTPPNPTLDVTLGGPPVTQQFQAQVAGTSTPVGATWSIDNVAIGTIDNGGLFTGGTAGGTATVTAQAGKLTGSTTVTVRLHINENPGNVDPGTQGSLKGGGKADNAFAWLYPYDQTIFPRGLLPPTLQFAGGAPTATYVHITAKSLEYEGFFGASNPGRVALSAATWKSITQSVGASDPVKVEVTKSTGGAVSGPITETWTIAQGSLKGTVYYNTYSSPLNNGSGAVMRIKPGSNADILSGGCTVCHAVSANGNMLVTLGGTQFSNSNIEGAYVNGETIDLIANKTTPRTGSQWGFPAVYPDGTMLLSNAALSAGWPPNVPGIGNDGQRVSQLIDLSTGTAITATGLAGNMLMPSFSPDGKKVVFNHYDADKGHTLATMDFDQATKAFSNLADVVTDPQYPGWPAYLPDDKSFVFHVVNHQDFATWSSSTGDLFVIDVATKTRVALDAANGVSGGQPYIPYGAADLHLNYEPTVLPIAVGGYYWVVFTSRRRLGNVITGPDPWGNQDRKKLWVVAVDMQPAPGKDPSHPAFYLEGQELGAGNMRGFWALDPCKQNGNSCESGDECCNGFCRQVNGPDGGQELVCVPPPSGCANEFEKCTTDGDCCDAPTGAKCINGHCAKPIPK